MHVPMTSREVTPSAHADQAFATQVQGQGYAFSMRLASLVAMDGLVILGAVGCSSLLVRWLSGQSLSASTGLAFFLAVAGVWWLFAWLTDLYDVPSLHRRAPMLLRLALAGVIGSAACLVVAYLLLADLTAGHIVLFIATAAPLMMAWRWFYLATLSMSALSHRALIVGLGERAQLAADLIKQESQLNYHLVGYVDCTGESQGSVHDGLPVWNNLVNLPQLARQFGIHEIVIATEYAPSKELALSLIECQAHGVQVLWLPELYERHRRSVPIDHIDPEWALAAVRAAPTLMQRAAKRLLDLAIVLLALPVLLILMPILILIIKLDSPGPAFYRQVRLGRAGKPFSIIKLRSMYVDAEQNGEARWATQDDPRITRVGRVLRKTRLDELPQLINVLLGEMSFIGPRPERPEFVRELEQHIPYYRTRLLVKPGLTGWAQVQYSYTSSVEDTFVKLQYDLYYIHRWSVWLDLYILFRTVAVVFQFKGT